MTHSEDPASHRPPLPRRRRPAAAVRNDPPWLQRRWSRQRAPLPREKLHWWSIHVLRFLKFIRTHQIEGPVDVLARQFLDDLAVHQPPSSEWQQDQVRKALEVFAGGVGSSQFLG